MNSVFYRVMTACSMNHLGFVQTKNQAPTTYPCGLLIFIINTKTTV